MPFVYFLQGATIVDQPVCIARWGQYDEPSNFWDRPSWSFEDYESTVCVLRVVIEVLYIFCLT